MKKVLLSIVFLLGLNVLFSSCEKDVSGISSLDGDYVLQKADVSISNKGETYIISFCFDSDSPYFLWDGVPFRDIPFVINGETLYPFRQLDEKEVKATFNDFANRFLFHDYECIFGKDGSLSVKQDYNDKKFETGRYKVDNGWIYCSVYGFDIATEKIVSNKGNSLVLELNPELLELLTIGKDYEITKSIGYYKKK